MFNTLAEYLRSKIDVSDAQLLEIEKLCTPQVAKRGDILLKVNEVCESAFFVTKGCLRSFVFDKKNKLHIIQFAPENWWITDRISLMTKEPAMFYIEAIEDTEYITVPEHFFDQLPSIVPGAERLTRELLLDIFRSIRKRLISLLSATGEDRYLDFIQSYPSLALRIPQKMIASYLGITPESLSRIRKTISATAVGQH
jgi:CRP-like cAMP-binding protein